MAIDYRKRVYDTMTAIQSVSRKKGNCTLSEIAGAMGIKHQTMLSSKQCLFHQAFDLLKRNTLVRSDKVFSDSFEQSFHWVYRPIKPNEECEAILGGLNWEKEETEAREIARMSKKSKGVPESAKAETAIVSTTEALDRTVEIPSKVTLRVLLEMALEELKKI